MNMLPEPLSGTVTPLARVSPRGKFIVEVVGAGSEAGVIERKPAACLADDRQVAGDGRGPGRRAPVAVGVERARAAGCEQAGQAGQHGSRPAVEDPARGQREEQEPGVVGR